MHKKNLIILSILFFLLSFSLFQAIQINTVYSVTTKNFQFRNTYPFNSATSTFSLIDSNIHNQSTFGQFTGNHNFINLAEVTSFVDTDNSGSGCSVSWQNAFFTHEGLLELIDTSGTYQADIYHDLNSDEYRGTFEFWLGTDDFSDTFNFAIYNAGTQIMRIMYDSDGSRIYKSGGYDTVSFDLHANTWIHTRIDYEVGAGGYMGLSADTYQVYINTVDYGVFTFITATNLVNKVRLFTAGTSIGDFFFDALGNTNEGYNINGNIIPPTTITSTQELDKYEFNYDNTGSLYQQGADNPQDWTDYQENGLDYVNIKNDPDEVFDRTVDIKVGSVLKEFGLYKTFNLENGFFNISFSIKNCILYNGTTTGYHYFNMSIYSYDDTLVSQISILDDDNSNYLKLVYYDGTHNQELAKFTQKSGDHYFNLLLGSLSLLTHNGKEYVIPSLANNHYGLGTVWFIAESERTVNSHYYLDNVGIYQNGTSVFSGYSMRIYNLTSFTTWDSQANPNLNCTILGNTSITIAGYYPTIDNIYSFEISSYSNFNNTFINYNLYNLNFILYSPYIIFIYNDSLTINGLGINGFCLKEGTNKYAPEITNHNINETESYFYVFNNKLKYTFTANDSNLEYMTIKFDINDLVMLNWTCAGGLYATGQFSTGVALIYTDGFGSFEYALPYYKEFNYIPPQTKVLDYFTFFVSDLDNDINSTGTGYFNSIVFTFFGELSFTISITNLISALLPLIVIMVMTFSIYGLIYYRNKKIAESSFIPLLLLSVIVLFIMGNIILWQFFTMITCIFMLMLSKRFK